MTRSSRPEALHESRTLVENAACMPEIYSALSGYGNAEARFKKGLDLFDGADGLSRNKAEDAKGIAALKLMGARKQSFAGWFDRSGTFCQNLNSPEWVRAATEVQVPGGRWLLYARNPARRAFEPALPQTFVAGAASRFEGRGWLHCILLAIRYS